MTEDFSWPSPEDFREGLSTAKQQIKEKGIGNFVLDISKKVLEAEIQELESVPNKKELAESVFYAGIGATFAVLGSEVYGRGGATQAMVGAMWIIGGELLSGRGLKLFKEWYKTSFPNDKVQDRTTA